jgi:hypothetical protein
LTAASLAGLGAAVAALAIGLAEPFDHDAWLVAYLFLVGFLAQFLLARGQTALLAAAGMPAASREVLTAQALLWNVGVVAVPLGVLADARIAVVLGGLSLLAALASLALTAHRAIVDRPRSTSRLAWGYAGLLVFMTASVFVGSALAWDTPWL